MLEFYVQIQSYVSRVAFETVWVGANVVFVYFECLPSVALEASTSQQLVVLFKETLNMTWVYLNFSHFFFKGVEMRVGGLQLGIAKFIE